MAGQGQLDQEVETAAEYGQRARCFTDHSGHSYSFAACVSSFKTTMVKAGENKLLNQIALQDLVPSRPLILDDLILDDVLEPREDLVQACLELPQDPATRIPPLFQGLDVYKSLLISTEPLALGSDPDTDLQDYNRSICSKRFGQSLKTWLPLAQISRQKEGESLDTPQSNRLRSLMQRKVENESLLLPNGALAILEELQHPAHGLSTELQEYLDRSTNHKLTSYTHPVPMTPPILPSSDNNSPFVPIDDSNVIDLTSPPSTPVNEHQSELGNIMTNEQLVPEPTVPISLPGSSPTQRLPDMLQNSRPSIQGLEMDLPVMISSDSESEENPLTHYLPLLPDADEPLAPSDEQVGTSDEAFKSLIHERASYVQALAAQEDLNKLASGSRIEVPILSFDIPQPAWSTKSLSAKTHFQHLQGEIGTGFTIHPVPRDLGVESSLRWNPVPSKHHTHVSAEEKLPDSVDAAEALLEDVMPMLNSSSFFAPKKDMAILNGAEDMELDTNDTATTSATTDEEARLQEDHDMSRRSESRSVPLPAQPWSTLLGSVSRELLDVKTNFLPRPSDTSATSALVASFMQLRGKEPKPPKMAPNSGNSVRGNIPQSSARPTPNMEESPSIPIPKIPAIAPQVQIPDQKGSFIISLALGRSIISHLEASWPPSKLIDVDFSRHNTSSRMGEATQPQGLLSTLLFDADIALSPSTGIIITNLLKVRQRALPGSHALAPLRERIKTVSQKYETLYVLVSESNLSGELTNPLSPSDVSAYADLVRFAVSLNAGLNVVLVPGADATLAKWILSLMCRYSAQTAPLGRFLSAKESSWGLFLRQAGFNVVAAKVLSGALLEDAGPSGLARYIVTPVKERIARYAGILGGEKVIRSSSERLDHGWG